MPVISVEEYLNQVRDTVDHVFAAIDLEETRISDVATSVPDDISDADLRSARDHFYQNYASMDMSEDFDEPQIMHAFVQYAAPARLIALHEITVGILYGSLLQIAKQAISIAHGGNGRNCGLGVEIGGLSTAQIIWDARNQALHFEEEAMPNTRETFNQLAAVFGNGFSLETNPGKNMARSIVREVLGWSDRESFITSIQSIATSE